ncbi:MAG: PIN domain-containing protein [Deltaproteobacteria bacterium]|nr:PIN domain-containing protein [Deltaproteobacteria bacterium]
MVLLDTDVMIDILRGYPPALAWLRSLNDDVIALPGFVLMELIQGCKTKKEQQSLSTELYSYKILWPSHSDYNDAVKLFTRYRLSHHIGIIDVLIGQLALSFDLPLHTFNKKHYEPIPRLTTVQPYTKE